MVTEGEVAGCDGRIAFEVRILDLLARNDIVRGNWTAAGLKAGPSLRNGKSVGQEWPTHTADGPISRKLGEKCGTRGAWKHEIIDRFAQDESFVGHRHPLISLWAGPWL